MNVKWILAVALVAAGVYFGITSFKKSVTPYISFAEAKQSTGIRRAAEEQSASKVHRNGEIKIERNGAVDGIGRAVQPKLYSIRGELIHFAVGAHIDRAKDRCIGNSKRIRPGQTRVIRKAEVTRSRNRGCVPGLINISMTWTGGCVDRHPGFVAAHRWAKQLPVRPAIGRAPNIASPWGRIRQAQIIKPPFGVRSQDRVAAKNIGFQHATEAPPDATVRRKAKAGLTEIAVRAIKLSPADGNTIRIGRIDAEGRLIGRIAGDILPGTIHIDLVARAKGSRNDGSR